MEKAEHDRQQLTEALLAAAHRALDADAEPPGTAELQAYLAGELPPEQSGRVRAWLMAHPADARRALELASMLNAAPPCRDDPADLAEAASWRDLQHRLTRDKTPTARGSATRRWLAVAASIFFLATSGLLFRVGNPVAARDIIVFADVRGPQVQRETIVPGEMLQMNIYVPALPAGCSNYDVDLLSLDGERLAHEPGLLGEDGEDSHLKFLWPAQAAETRLVVEACGTTLARPRLDFVEGSN